MLVPATQSIGTRYSSSTLMHADVRRAARAAARQHQADLGPLRSGGRAAPLRPTQRHVRSHRERGGSHDRCHEGANTASLLPCHVAPRVFAFIRALRAVSAVTWAQPDAAREVCCRARLLGARVDHRSAAAAPQTCMPSLRQAPHARTEYLGHVAAGQDLPAERHVPGVDQPVASRSWWCSWWSASCRTRAVPSAH